MTRLMSLFWRRAPKSNRTQRSVGFPTSSDADYRRLAAVRDDAVEIHGKEHKGRFLPNGTTLISQDQRIRQQQRTTEPPDPACIFAWKSAMSVEERTRFKLVTGDLLRELGYEV